RASRQITSGLPSGAIVFAHKKILASSISSCLQIAAINLSSSLHEIAVRRFRERTSYARTLRPTILEARQCRARSAFPAPLAARVFLCTTRAAVTISLLDRVEISRSNLLRPKEFFEK